MNRMKDNARSSPGVGLLLTGLPAAGKTTLGRALADRLAQGYERPVTLLDGDEVRRLLSSELGYSREHRRINALRHAFIAAEVCRHGGIAICALIAPYRADRHAMREMVARRGSFVEVYLSTPLEVCEKRDPKGLYSRARAGLLTHMTGIDDPYERPEKPDIALDGGVQSIAQMTDAVVEHLLRAGLLDGRRTP